jgi:MarR family transcriptional regulator, organic hydroperoxide resistance regulator
VQTNQKSLLYQHLAEFLHSLESHFKKQREAVEDELGISQLTVSQLGYLETIYALPAPTVTQLANTLGITKASVTVAINKLIKAGYIHKTPATHDKRIIYLRLSEKGRRLIQVKDETLRAYVAFMDRVLTADETARFSTILSKLLNHDNSRGGDI